MLHDGVWNLTGVADGMLCVGCVERRLGRQLVPGDFAPVHINEPCSSDTLRLAARKAGLPESALQGRWPPSARAARAA